MNRRARKIGAAALAWSLGLTAGASALAAATAVEQGWAPLVTLTGRGDPATAVSHLSRVTAVIDSMLERLVIDEATKQLGIDAWEELEDFQLRDFYELLPQQDGGFRAAAVRGELDGKDYRISRAKLGTPFEVTMNGSRHVLGDFSSVLRARPTEGYGDHHAFLLQTRAGVAIGPIPWTAMMAAATDGLRLVSGDAPTQVQASAEARAAVKRAYPALAPADIDVIALLWDAFPASHEAFADIGRIEDVVSERVGAVDHVHFKARLSTDRLKKHYPDLAKHLGKLKELMSAKLHWVDTRGRSVLEGSIDSATLTVTADCYLKDGRLVPFTKDRIAADEAIDPLGPALAKSKVVFDVRVKMLGVIVSLDRLRAHVQYEPHGSYAKFVARVTEVPGIRVDGAALGFVPTVFVDMMIPGNIESVTRDMLNVAVHGNEGRGVAVTAAVGSATDQGDAVIEGSAGFEALDTFLVRTGMGIVNDRVLPDDDTTDEIRALFKRFHNAFTSDLRRFQKLHGESG